MTALNIYLKSTNKATTKPMNSNYNPGNPLLQSDNEHSTQINYVLPTAPPTYMQIDHEENRNIENASGAGMIQPSAPELSLEQRRELAAYGLL